MPGIVPTTFATSAGRVGCAGRSIVPVGASCQRALPGLPALVGALPGLMPTRQARAGPARLWLKRSLAVVGPPAAVTGQGLSYWQQAHDPPTSSAGSAAARPSARARPGRPDGHHHGDRLCQREGKGPPAPDAPALPHAGHGPGRRK